MNSPTYMTCAELADRLRVSERTIREDWKDSILIEGRHWVKPFGRRRILFMWEQIQEDIHRATSLERCGMLAPSPTGALLNPGWTIGSRKGILLPSHTSTPAQAPYVMISKQPDTTSNTRGYSSSHGAG